MTGSIPRSRDLAQALTEVKTRLVKIPQVLAEPTPEVNLLSFTEGSCKLAIRPYVRAPHYWEVCAATAESLRDMLDSLALPGHEAEEGEGEAFEAGETAEGEEGAEEAGEAEEKDSAE
jgi:small conductance mechanosensitive channel